MRVLRSIKPYWMYLILKGIKKMDLGKTFPTILELPGHSVEVLCYCSKDMKSFKRIPKEDQAWMQGLLGKVPASFTCDDVAVFFSQFVDSVSSEGLEDSCVSIDEFKRYARGKTVYGWVISNLKMFDVPVMICELYHEVVRGALPFRLIRPPQSWQYII